MMVYRILGIFLLSIINSIAYRYGGSSSGQRWVRPVGMMICSTFALIVLGYIHWTLILTAGAFYGLSTTYFKRDGTDAKLINWLLVGLAFSIAVLPIVLVYHNWIGFLIRTITCTGLVVIWSEAEGRDIFEELGRGFIAIATLPLLLIGT